MYVFEVSLTAYLDACWHGNHKNFN